MFEAIKKVRLIQERLKVMQGQQKPYSNMRKREQEFNIDDWVYQKISPMKGIMYFGKKVKLSPHYVGLHQILR